MLCRKTVSGFPKRVLGSLNNDFFHTSDTYVSCIFSWYKCDIFTLSMVCAGKCLHSHLPFDLVQAQLQLLSVISIAIGIVIQGEPFWLLRRVVAL